MGSGVIIGIIVGVVLLLCCIGAFVSKRNAEKQAALRARTPPLPVLPDPGRPGPYRRARRR
eukprot:gene20928-22109_t